MKNVLVLVHDDVGQEARFQGALDITRALGGHLTCIDVAILPVVMGGFMEPSGTAMLMAEEAQRESANKADMEARLKAEAVPYSWIDETGFLSPSVRDNAARADIVVLNRVLDTIQYPDMRELVGEVVVRTGKPIVAMPELVKGFNARGNTLIAWDGSPSAVAAMHAAVPLLQRAGSVTIVEVDDGSIKLPAEVAAEYLAQHGIKAGIRRESNELNDTATVILDSIAGTHASYLVMGGFGHSRFVEAVLGGVTRRMLQECPIPLFLTH